MPFPVSFTIRQDVPRAWFAESGLTVPEQVRIAMLAAGLDVDHGDAVLAFSAARMPGRHDSSVMLAKYGDVTVTYPTEGTVRIQVYARLRDGVLFLPLSLALVAGGLLPGFWPRLVGVAAGAVALSFYYIGALGAWSTLLGELRPHTEPPPGPTCALQPPN